MSTKRSASRAILPRGRAQTHGGYTFLTTGKLPEHRRAGLAYLLAARAGLVRDLGPTEKDLTAAQIILIDRTVTALGIVRVIEEHVREAGVMRGSNLAPSLQASYLAYVNHVRLNLVALGIKTKAGEGVIDLQAYIKAKDRAKDAEKSMVMAKKARPEAVVGKAEPEGSGMDDKAGSEILPLRGCGEGISRQDEQGIDSEAESGQDQGSEHEQIGQPEPLGETGQGERQ